MIACSWLTWLNVSASEIHANNATELINKLEIESKQSEEQRKELEVSGDVQLLLGGIVRSLAVGLTWRGMVRPS